MPDYFYHIAVELCQDSTATTTDRPPNLTHYFKTLRPFSTQTTKRGSRTQIHNRKSGGAQQAATQSTKECEDQQDKSHFCVDDHRLDYIQIDAADMADLDVQTRKNTKDNIVGKGIGSAISSQHIKGRYQPLEAGEPAWGIVHLYRDAEETPGLYKDSPLHTSDLWSDVPQNRRNGKPHPPAKDDECTSLCILAVPSYMTPADFLAFVGEETRNAVSHFRMVRTTRANRYMVLMKFSNGKRARDWQHEWNGKVFNSMEPETCHVVFLKSVELIQSTPPSANGVVTTNDGTSYPRMTNDPFIPATTKPLAPRTPSLVELPTCPVCLERMDETTGLLTIPCQHVFHCTCLQKWSGGGCPVCRYTHDDFSSRGTGKYRSKIPGEYEIDDQPLECETCHADVSLWQCLICGKVGCGRYEGKHAYAHFQESGHSFSMDLDSMRVWDYAGDSYVHRIIQDASRPGEKLVELPGRRKEPTALEGQEDTDMLKMENVALEYTHLLTSQLESQRVYFEEIVERAVDKATQASKRAEQALAQSSAVTEKLTILEREHDFVAKGKVPELEKEKNRHEIRAKRLEEMAKNVNQKYLEEKSSANGLMERLKYLESTEIEALKQKIKSLEEDNATKELLMEGLREEHRDAMIQVSAEKQLREMVQRGELDPEELEGATITAGKRPLTARERLRERLDTGKAVRAGKRTVLDKQAEGKKLSDDKPNASEDETSK